MENRVFKRKFYEKMLAWKRDKDGSTALMIKALSMMVMATCAIGGRLKTWPLSKNLPKV